MNQWRWINKAIEREVHEVVSGGLEGATSPDLACGVLDLGIRVTTIEMMISTTLAVDLLSPSDDQSPVLLVQEPSILEPQD